MVKRAKTILICLSLVLVSLVLWNLKPSQTYMGFIFNRSVELVSDASQTVLNADPNLFPINSDKINSEQVSRIYPQNAQYTTLDKNKVITEPVKFNIPSSGNYRIAIDLKYINPQLFIKKEGGKIYIFMQPFAFSYGDAQVSLTDSNVATFTYLSDGDIYFNSKKLELVDDTAQPLARYAFFDAAKFAEDNHLNLQQEHQVLYTQNFDVKSGVQDFELKPYQTKLDNFRSVDIGQFNLFCRKLQQNQEPTLQLISSYNQNCFNQTLTQFLTGDSYYEVEYDILDYFFNKYQSKNLHSYIYAGYISDTIDPMNSSIFWQNDTILKPDINRLVFEGQDLTTASNLNIGAYIDGSRDISDQSNSVKISSLTINQYPKLNKNAIYLSNSGELINYICEDGGTNFVNNAQISLKNISKCKNIVIITNLPSNKKLKLGNEIITANNYRYGQTYVIIDNHQNSNSLVLNIQ